MAIAQGLTGTKPSSGQSSWWRRNQRKIAPYVFISPFFVLFMVFHIYPILYSFWLSFFKGLGFDKKTFYGLGNYLHLFQDPRYLMAVANTTEYALGILFILSPLALLVALAINSAFVRWKTIYKLGIFFPVITSPVIIAVIFSRVFDTQFGLLNTLLHWFHIAPVGWLTDKHVVMPSFILIGIWTHLGISTLFWLAGLSGINREYYEAAAIDGAGRWHIFWRITLPLLRPMVLFIVIQAIISSYNLFAEPMLLTKGGPSDASLTVTFYMYTQSFLNFNVGYGSAIAYSMTALLLVLSVLNIKLFGGYGTATN